MILSYLSCSTNNLEDEADYFSLEQMVKRKLIKMFPASSTKEEDPGLLVVRTVPLNRAVLSVCVRLDGRFIINAEPINNQSLPFVRLSVTPVAWTVFHDTFDKIASLQHFIFLQCIDVYGSFLFLIFFFFDSLLIIK